MSKTNRLIFGEKRVINDENMCDIIEIKEIKPISKPSPTQTNNTRPGQCTSGMLATELLADRNSTFRQRLQLVQQLTSSTGATIVAQTKRHNKRLIINMNELRRKPYPCRTCYQRFRTSVERQSHEKDVHDLTSKRFTDLKTYSSVKSNNLMTTKSLTANPTNTSTITTTVPKVYRRLSNKNMTANRSNRVKCLAQHCNEIYQDFGQMSAHMVHSHGWHRCPYTRCHYLTDLAGKLSAHTSMVHRAPDHWCCQCSYRTDRQFLIEKHRKTHDSSNDFRCGVAGCDEPFEREWDLEMHSFEDHRDICVSIVCQMAGCGARFGCRQHLYDHTCQTHGAKCQVCRQQFFDGQELANHLKAVHSSTKCYTCRINNCEHRFDTQWQLDFHRQFIHSNQLLYVCDKCEYLCHTDDDWTRHLLSERHQQIQTTQSAPESKCQYKCNYGDCGQQFKSYYYLSKHKRTAHESRGFVCHRFGCTRRFDTREALNYHLTSTYP